ncbi:MAG: TetR family transcriptional regulator [Actinobacteria bacterium]|uniref:Unannotated protein n=1 Tax=freshwater metagenome TaxID=449393 RepID=A0A6J5YXV0_9ZZZZ|nr:TetR family transcriptional regulator [Actinomycetota bacterium]
MVAKKQGANKPATKAPAPAKPGGRQASYVARNRAALIRSAQEVLASIGLNATIEEIANHAQVSPTTLYKYFPNKEVLFSEALDQIWREWVFWGYNGVAPGKKLEDAIDVCRKLFWIKQTHPLFARILHNALERPTMLINYVYESGAETFRELAKRGEITSDNLEQRMKLFSYSLAGILSSVHVTEELSPSEAEVSLGIALSVFGISPAKVNKLLSRALIFMPTN